MKRARRPTERRTGKGAPKASFPDVLEKLLTAAGSRFSVRGNQVVFRNQNLLFAGDPANEAPERVLLVALPVEGNGDAVAAHEVAKSIASLLSRKRKK